MTFKKQRSLCFLVNVLKSRGYGVPEAGKSVISTSRCFLIEVIISTLMKIIVQEQTGKGISIITLECLWSVQ